jgi:hypothetical protein
LAVVLIAVGAWAGLRPTPVAVLPAGPPASPALHLPGSLDILPPITSALPGTVVLDNFTGPSGEAVDVAGRLDPGHLLVIDSTAAYSYSLTDRTTRPLVTGTRFLLHGNGPRIALSPHWIIWASPAPGNTMTIYRAPRQGGTPQAITAKPVGDVGLAWYATDDAVFWTTNDEPQSGHLTVGKLTVSTGEVSRPPELAGMLTYGTAWALRPTDPDDPPNSPPSLLRNMVTGETRAVAHTADWTMRCSPSFCTGDLPGGDRIFVQHLDGTGRLTATLPAASAEPMSLIINTTGGLLAFGRVVVDPISGRAGNLPIPSSATCFGYDTASGQPFLTWGLGTGCADRSGTVILPYGG